MTTREARELAAGVSRMARELEEVRLESANRLAAMRAALAAAESGE
jgi:hypothetical protein